MYSIRIIILFVCFFLVSGCSTNKKNSQKDDNTATVVDSVKINSDTMPTPEPPPPGLSPGTAIIKGKIVESGNKTDNSTASYVKIRIDEVLGYGASTPPLGTNDTLKVHTGSADQNRFKIGKIVSAVISYQQLPVVNNGNSSRWALVKLENDSN